MKVGKEELCGLLAALEWSLAQDEPATIQRYEDLVRFWIDGLQSIPGVTAERVFPSEAGQPHARAVVRFAPPFPLGRDEVAAALWDRSPRIAVSTAGHGVPEDGIALNPQTVEPGEEEAVLRAVREVAMAAAGVVAAAD
jgi:L-seryl-tRNA(Ser) seleniumtransferase